MIVALVAAFAMAQAVPPPTADDEIVVIGQRLKNLRIVVKRDRRNGGKRCFLKPTSGDAVLDAGVCEAYLTCVVTVTTAPMMEACMRPPLTVLINDWAARQKAAPPATPR